MKRLIYIAIFSWIIIMAVKTNRKLDEELSFNRGVQQLTGENR